ncbi:MAG: hypothetical protein RL136_2299 [Planctomycetota bacterium]
MRTFGATMRTWLSTLTAGSILLAWMPGGSAAAQCPTAQSCIEAHAQPGCDSEACCLAVCNLDPTCCVINWDSNCVLFANNACIGYCGAEASGNCFAAHANPACNDATCCDAVCTLDPFCCSSAWDTNCALFAGFACPGNPGTCGVTQASCFEPHTQGACNDVDCCNAVCSIDPSCCDQSWDTICVFTAEKVCVFACVPTFEKGYELEIEGCDVRLNDPCYGSESGGVPETLTPNLQKAGSLGRPPNSMNGPDVDTYTIALEDTDGDGLVRITVGFVSSPGAWMAMMPDSACAPLSSAVLQLSSALCVDTISEPTCVPPGVYRIVIAGGTFPEIGGGDIPCTFGNLYGIKVMTSTQACDPCAPTGPSCFIPHSEGGCNEPSCCSVICATDPFCCDASWDGDCVATAVATCSIDPPVNESCASAAPVGFGEYAFNPARASLDGAQPATCGATFLNDVWFVYDSDRTGLVDFSTCGTWFDTSLAIYEGACGKLSEIACNDDGTICGGAGASRVTLDVSCGTRYYIRVGSRTAVMGEGVFRIADFESAECPQCPADLDGNGTVGAPDITLLLNGWGGAGGDIDGNGTTDALDLAALLNSWGACP